MSEERGKERSGPPSPREPSGGEPVGGRRRASYTLLYMVLAFLLLIALNHYVVQSVRASFLIDYSTFLEVLDGGKVERVAVSQDEASGKLKEKARLPVLLNGERAREQQEVERFTVQLLPGDEELLAKALREQRLEQPDLLIVGSRDDGLWKSVLLFWILPSVLLFGGLFFLLRLMSPNRQVMSFGKSRAKVYAEKETRVTFDDVAGIDEAKDELREIVEYLRNPEPYRRLGARIPRGILLVGPPGTGKTLLARAVAGEANVVFFSLSGSDFVEMFAGVGASRVRDLFEQAQKSAPCIVFVDELDALGKVRGVGLTGAHDEREQTLNQLLSEMDGFDPNKGVVILAATNRPEILDPALLRPGRFDRQVVVDRPDVKGREKILRIHAQKVKLAAGVNLEALAKQTPGLVGADLANVINEGALLAGRRGKESVEQDDLEEAIQRTLIGLERKSRLMSPSEKERIAVHETGHALVAISVPYADPVSRISIVARGVGALGYTLHTPAEDRMLMTHRELEDRLAVLLGGRGAEMLIYEDTSTGASDDLGKAVDIAKRMVSEFGMSERLGPVNLGHGPRQRFLGGIDNPNPPDYSDVTAREVDEEVRRIVRATEERVTRLLSSAEPALRAVASHLLLKEVIGADELASVARAHGLVPVERRRPALQLQNGGLAAADSNGGVPAHREVGGDDRPGPERGDDAGDGGREADDAHDASGSRDATRG